MADTQLRPPTMSITNSLRATATQGGSGSNLGNASNYVSIVAMRTRLAAINGTYYTAAKLDQMSANDMVYALRMCDDRTTIADYLPVSTA